MTVCVAKPVRATETWYGPAFTPLAVSVPVHDAGGLTPGGQLTTVTLESAGVGATAKATGRVIAHHSPTPASSTTATSTSAPPAAVRRRFMRRLGPPSTRRVRGP